MKFMIEGRGFQGSQEEFASFIGSPEHLRRVRKHQEALGVLAAERLNAHGGKSILVSVGMGPPAEAQTIVNRGDQNVVIDGPFAETKELLAGFDIADFPTLEDAAKFAEGEHLTDVDFLGTVRPLDAMWWINHFRPPGNVASSFSKQEPSLLARVFMLSRFSPRETAANDRERVARLYQKVGAEYFQQAMGSGDQPASWCGGIYRANDGHAFRMAGGKVVPIEFPRRSDGKQMDSFVLVTCESRDQAAKIGEKLATRVGDTIEIRTANGFWWTYND